MTWEIYVEGQKIDPPEGTSAQITFNIDDIRDFAARNTAFSKTIILPATATNKKVFGHVFDAGSSNIVDDENPNVGYDYNASKAASCIMFIDQMQVFKGVIRIMDIVVDGSYMEFEVAVFGELGGLISNIADKKLEQLDFAAYNHTFNLGNLTGSWSEDFLFPSGTGYYYPHMDMGYSTDKIIFPIESFRPALHVREYVDKMLDQAGYTFASDFMDTDYFKRLIIPFNGAYPAKVVQTAFQASMATYTSPSGAGSTGFFQQIPINDVVGTNYFRFVAEAGAVPEHIVWDRADTVKMKAKFTANWTRALGTAFNLKLTIVRVPNGNTAIPNEEIVLYEEVVTGTSGTINVELPIDVEQGDWYNLWSNCTVIDGSQTFTFTPYNFYFVGSPDIAIPLTFNDSVDMNSCIPKNVFQLDLLKWLIKMFNLYIYEDPDTVGHVLIKPYVDFYGTTVEDWDGKLDRSKPFKYTPMGEINSRSYEYTYKDDKDYYNELYKTKYQEIYGSRFYDTGLDFVKDKNKVEVGFSPSPLVQYSNSDRVQVAVYKKKEDGTEERMAHGLRILFRSDAPQPCQDWTISYISGGTPLTNLMDYGYAYAGHVDSVDALANDLNFGVPQELYFTIIAGDLSANLFNVFWSRYIGEVSDKDSKLLKGNFKLTPQDIMTLDFSKPKYINGQLWRLNKIIDWSTDGIESTKCELLKVIDLV